MNMNAQTRQRINKVSEIVYNRHGNVADVSNLLAIAQRESDIFGVGLAWKTTKNYLSLIEKEIKRLDIRNKIISKQEEVKNTIDELEKDAKIMENNKIVTDDIEAGKKEIDFIIVVFTDGSIKKEKASKEPIPEEVKWTGLFNYRNDGTITIRRGTYSGCDITSKASIMDKFKSIRFYDMWCRGRLDEANNGKITIMPDTARDVETLKKVISRLDSLKSDKFL